MSLLSCLSRLSCPSSRASDLFDRAAPLHTTRGDAILCLTFNIASFSVNKVVVVNLKHLVRVAELA